MTPPRAARTLASKAPNAKLVTVQAGHAMMTEAPEETLSALKEFLGA